MLDSEDGGIFSGPIGDKKPIGEPVFSDPVGGGGGPAPETHYILREDGGRLLREDGGFMLRESA